MTGLIIAITMTAWNLHWAATSYQVTLHLVGDSTMSDKPVPDVNPERGWGQMLHLFFNDSVDIRNHAINGRSTKSFMEEGSWDRVRSQIAPGDFVIIQFAHNDQKEKDPARYTNPFSSYRRNLEKYVLDTRTLGAHPLLASPIVRRKFNAEGVLVDTHGAYPHVLRQVATELDVPFLDLQLFTEDLVRELGPDRSKALYLWLDENESDMHPGGLQDDTHLSVHGATEVAKLAARALVRLDHPLSRYIVEK